MATDAIINKMFDLLSREQLGEMCKKQQEEIKILEKKIEVLEGWKTRSEQYESYRIPETGAVVIKDKKNNWYCCAVCFEKDKAIIPLQPSGSSSVCPSCKVYFKTKPYPEENFRQEDLQSYGIMD